MPSVPMPLDVGGSGSISRLHQVPANFFPLLCIAENNVLEMIMAHKYLKMKRGRKDFFHYDIRHHEIGDHLNTIINIIKKLNVQNAIN